MIMRTAFKNRSQNGMTLIWIIASFTILSALIAGIVSITSSNRMNELNLNYDNRARYLAESGLNYAASYIQNIKTGALVYMSDLNNITLTTGLQTGEQIDLTVSGPTTTNGTNYYTITSTGTVNNNSSAMTKYKTTNILSILKSYEDDRDSGKYITQNTSVITTSPSSITANAISVTDFTGGITLNPTKTNSDNTGNYFNGAIGTFNKGIRVYFKFKITSASEGDGFVFAIKNAGINSPYDCGGPRTGSHGCFMAYAGPGLSSWGYGMGIRPPKIGLEFDIYKNRGPFSCTDQDNRNDHDGGHIALVYWGAQGYITSSNYIDSSCPTLDDNVHGLPSSTTSSAPTNPDTTRETDIDNGRYHGVRIEIKRTTNSDSTGTYVIKVWYDCSATACQDVTSDYSGSASFTETISNLDATLNSYFNTFYYGYQIATGASTESLVLTYPKIEIIN